MMGSRGRLSCSPQATADELCAERVRAVVTLCPPVPGTVTSSSILQPRLRAAWCLVPAPRGPAWPRWGQLELRKVALYLQLDGGVDPALGTRFLPLGGSPGPSGWYGARRAGRPLAGPVSRGVGPTASPCPASASASSRSPLGGGRDRQAPEKMKVSHHLREDSIGRAACASSTVPGLRSCRGPAARAGCAVRASCSPGL